MSFLRNILHDLIQKKLWPVAIALVVALIAVPILLGGSDQSGSAGADAAALPATSGTANNAARAQVVSLEDQAAGKVKRPGKTRDPFVQHHVHTTPTESASTSTPATTTTSGGSTGTETTATTPATTTTTTKTTTPKSSETSADLYHVNLKFGENGDTKDYTNVARLTPLPSSTNPFFVYLGLKSDTKTAVFLVSSDAVPSGDGTCSPSPDNCEQISLQEGDVEFFDLQSGTAGVVQYQLELSSISKTTAATKASAAAAHARESQAGREYLRQIVADDPTALSSWDYSSALGLLIAKPVPATAKTATSAATATGRAAVTSTATVVTVPSSTTP